MKVLVVYNPVAGSKKLGDTERIIRKVLKKKGYEFDFFTTIQADKQPLEQFIGKKYDKIIVSGGDGTVAEVTTFMIVNKIKIPLIIIPQGSGNILALSLNIPLMPGQALLRGLKKEGKALDAMKINERYGIIATGCGYDTLVMQKTSRKLKRKWGIIAYLWTILKTILIYRSRYYKLYIDGKRETVLAKAIMTFNLIPLGHLKINKSLIGDQIIGNDGILNLFVLNPHPIRHLFRLRKGIRNFQGKKISIKTKKETRFQIDGNVFRGKSVNIEVVPKAIHIVY